MVKNFPNEIARKIEKKNNFVYIKFYQNIN